MELAIFASQRAIFGGTPFAPSLPRVTPLLNESRGTHTCALLSVTNAQCCCSLAEMGVLTGRPSFLLSSYRSAFQKLSCGRSVYFTNAVELEICLCCHCGKKNARFRSVVTLNSINNRDGEASNFANVSLSNKTVHPATYTAGSDSYFQSSLLFQNRKLWTSMPVQMGRRSSKIALRKGTQDAKKAKLYGRFGKEIVSAIKRGGSTNPVSNSALAALLQYAKDFDIPKEIVERNIKKASEKGQEDYAEITYEAYGYGGVGIVIEVLTDNLNRAAAQVRDAVKRSGCKMADPGSVLFNFKKAGAINVRADKVDGDVLLAAAMDAGAEDVIEPTYDEDEDPNDKTDKFFKVITPVDQYTALTKKLQAAGIPVDVECSGLELIPIAPCEVDDEALELNKALMDRLLELDDVDAVYSNQAF